MRTWLKTLQRGVKYRVTRGGFLFTLAMALVAAAAIASANNLLFLVVATNGSYHSSWAAQSVYPTLTPGAVSGVLIVQFTNTGTLPWVKGAVGQQANLGVVNDNNTWSGLGVGWLTSNRVATCTKVMSPQARTRSRKS